LIEKRGKLELVTLPIFQDVPEELLSLVTPEMEQSFTDGDVIFRQGDEADGLLVLLHGQVCIRSDDDIHLITRQPYTVIGEQAFINESSRTATAIALGYVKALAIPRTIVERLMANAIFVKNLLRLVSEKLAEATSERAVRFRNERMLFTEFRAHVSQEIANRLLSTGRSYGEPRYIDAIILFSDIRSFTERSSNMEPEDIAVQLSNFLDAVVDIIHRHDGLVDKFIGDAVMAIWGYAASDEDIAAQAFNCAEEMVHAAASMQFGETPIEIGIGLNAGQVFIGNIGGEGKRQFTVLGSPVNLASRFESASKDLKAPIVMGHSLYERLPENAQTRLITHDNISINGAETQTLYTCNAGGLDQKEK
jgi:class 3 adenylate cyclase